jgi:hypothetical protein
MDLPTRLDKTWEKIAPGFTAVLGHAPGGAFLVGQWGQFGGTGHAAVWDVATKKIAWRVEGHTALCWVGDEILATRSDASGDAIEWYRWSDRQKLGSLPLTFPRGRLTHGPRLFGSEAGGVTAIVWIDQSEGGIALLKRSGDGWTVFSEATYWQDKSNYVGDARFSPSGRRVAMPIGAPDGWEHDAATPPCCGTVVVLETQTGARQFLDVFADIQPGWERPLERSPSPVILAFDHETELRVELQNGQLRTLAVDPE